MSGTRSILKTITAPISAARTIYHSTVAGIGSGALVFGASAPFMSEIVHVMYGYTLDLAFSTSGMVKYEAIEGLKSTPSTMFAGAVVGGVFGGIFGFGYGVMQVYNGAPKVVRQSDVSLANNPQGLFRLVPAHLPLEKPATFETKQSQLKKAS